MFGVYRITEDTVTVINARIIYGGLTRRRGGARRTSNKRRTSLLLKTASCQRQLTLPPEGEVGHTRRSREIQTSRRERRERTHTIPGVSKGFFLSVFGSVGMIYFP